MKHVARELAEKAGVPIVPGTKGLVDSEDDALHESERIGYPVILKATSGGGGMGLAVCTSAEEVRAGFQTVRSRGETLFKGCFWRVRGEDGEHRLIDYRFRLFYREVHCRGSPYRSTGVW